MSSWKRKLAWTLFAAWAPSLAGFLIGWALATYPLLGAGLIVLLVVALGVGARRGYRHQASVLVSVPFVLAVGVLAMSALLGVASGMALGLFDKPPSSALMDAFWLGAGAVTLIWAEWLLKGRARRFPT